MWQFVFVRLFLIFSRISDLLEISPFFPPYYSSGPFPASFPHFARFSRPFIMLASTVVFYATDREALFQIIQGVTTLQTIYMVSTTHLNC